MNPFVIYAHFLHLKFKLFLRDGQKRVEWQVKDRRVNYHIDVIDNGWYEKYGIFK